MAVHSSLLVHTLYSLCALQPMTCIST